MIFFSKNALESWSANRASVQSECGSCAQAGDSSPLMGGSRHLSLSVLDGKSLRLRDLTVKCVPCPSIAGAKLESGASWEPWVQGEKNSATSELWVQGPDLGAFLLPLGMTGHGT